MLVVFGHPSEGLGNIFISRHHRSKMLDYMFSGIASKSPTTRLGKATTGFWDSPGLRSGAGSKTRSVERAPHPDLVSSRSFIRGETIFTEGILVPSAIFRSLQINSEPLHGRFLQSGARSTA
jgi:hypothetical protein